jgi:hypothetical protein
MKTTKGLRSMEEAIAALREVKPRKVVKRVSPREVVEQFLAEAREIGEDHYRLTLRIGGIEGKTLGELIEAGRWEDAMDAVRRVQAGNFW